jgi:hypothetical protein
MPVPHTDTAPSATAAEASGLSALIRDAAPGQFGEVTALPVRPNFPFFLLHWPSAWQVEHEGLEEPTWIPLLAQQVILPGCNLHRTLRRGEPPSAAYDAAVLRNTRRGAVFLDVERHRAPDGGRYLREAPCRDPRSGREGVYYLDAFTKPLDAIPGRRLRFVRDRAASNRWCLSLVEPGVLSAPSEQVVDEVLRRHANRVSRARSLTNLDRGEYERRVADAVEREAYYRGAIRPRPRRDARVEALSAPGRIPDLDGADA